MDCSSSFSFRNIGKIFRFNHWWNYKTSHILAFTYLYNIYFEIPLSNRIAIFLLTIVAIFGNGALGYVINDFYDKKTDAIAGKKNSLAEKSSGFIVLMITGLLILAILPWLVLRTNLYIWLALLFQLVLYLTYSHPAIRLKEKSFWGPLCDALYGHALPVIIFCYTYQQYLTGELPYPEILFFLSLFFWQFFKGIRNIFLHQLSDFTNDSVSNVKTFATEYGRDRLYRFVLYIISPLEILCFIIFSLTLGLLTYWTLLFFFVFILIYFLGHGLFRNIVWNPSEYSSNTYLYFLNDFYEIYLPFSMVAIGVIFHSELTVLLALHVIVFPYQLVRIYIDVKKSCRELIIQAENFFILIYRNFIK